MSLEKGQLVTRGLEGRSEFISFIVNSDWTTNQSDSNHLTNIFQIINGLPPPDINFEDKKYMESILEWQTQS